MARHRASAADTARYWLEDAERIERMPESTGIITFEALVGNPVATLQRFQEYYYQLPEAVLRCAAAKLKPDRQDPNRWERKVDQYAANEIRRCVDEMGLIEKYNDLEQRAVKASDVIAEAGRLGGIQGKIRNPGILLRLALQKVKRRLS